MSDPNTDIVYFNARISGKKSGLFSKSAVEDFLNQGDLQRMQDVLLESTYRKEMAEALTRHQGPEAIEEALSRNLAETYRGLVKQAQGDFSILIRLFLTRWDLDAVKSLLRCQHHNIDADAALHSLIPGPTMSLPLLHEFVQMDSMQELVQALAAANSMLCGCLRKALSTYEENNDLFVLEEALDRQYFVQTAKVLGESEDPDAAILREQLSAEIDRINIRLLMQAFQDGGDKELAAQRLLPEGTLSLGLLKSMLDATDAAAAMEQLANTRYQALMEELFQFLQTGRFSPIERYFERVLMQRLYRMALQAPFGIGVAMNYVWLKYNEVINLRLIAHGLSGNVPEGRVREELYFVS